MSRLKESSILPRFSVTRPVTVVMIFIALLVVGYIAYTKIPLEMLPTGYDPPFMGVWVPYPNASPEEIENQICRPIEDMVGTIRNIKSTRSSIGRDFCWVGIQFNQGTDMDMAYAELRDRMDRVKPDLPSDVERVFVRKFNMNDDADMWIALRIVNPLEDMAREENSTLTFTRAEDLTLIMEASGVSTVETLPAGTYTGKDAWSEIQRQYNYYTNGGRKSISAVDMSRMVASVNSDAQPAMNKYLKMEATDLYYFMENNIGKKLRRIEGVANVDFDGVEEKNFEIELEMDKLSAHKINLFQMIENLRDTNFALPSGHVLEGDKRLFVRSMAKFENIEQIKKLEVKPGVLVENLGTVKFDVPDRQNLTRIDSSRGVWIAVTKESGANSVDIHKKVMSTLDEEFANNRSLSDLERGFVFSQGQMIIDSLDDLQETAMWAGLFAVAVLFFFLRHLRMTLVITLAIPISLLVTLVVMYFTGETLNLLTLMGLMVSVGLVVDNSVVVVENIFRHRRAKMEAKPAAIKGASEVGLAVVMATLTTVVVFTPMILMGGGTMSFFMGRIGFPVIFALLSSLFVALVFIPLATTLFKDQRRIQDRSVRGYTRERYAHILTRFENKGPLFSILRSLVFLPLAIFAAFSLMSSGIINSSRNRYIKILSWSIDHRVETAILSVFILVAIFGLTGGLGYEDEMQDSIDTSIRLRLAKKYSDINGFPKTIAEKTENWVRDHQKEMDYDVISTWVQDNYIRITLFRSTKRNTTSLAEKPVLWVKNMFGINDMQKDPEAERRSFVHDNLLKDIGLEAGEAEVFVGWQGGQSGQGSVEIVLEGNDYNELRLWGERVREQLKTLPGIVNVESEIERGTEEMSITLNRELARAANVDTRWAASTISTAIRGINLPKFQEKDREIDVIVRLREEDRRNVDDLKNLRIPTMDGGEVPLSSIARFDNTRGPSRITHWNRKPNFSLTITGEDDRLDKLMPLVAGAMQNLGNGPDYTYSFGDRRRQMDEDTDNFQFAAILAVTFVFLLMGVLFESFALPLTIISCLPFAFAGSTLLLKIYAMPANLFAFIGIIIIIGVVVNNGIVLVDLINRLRTNEGMERKEAILQAGYYRYRPILMTAGTTVFSLIPMAFGDSNLVGMPYNPLGMAMIGGLTLNSVLTLLLVPIFYTFFADLRKVGDWLMGILAGKKAVRAATGRAGAMK